MTGKVIIVTGANSGLGYEVSRYLCEGGNDVILACRNEERANRAIDKIKRQNPNALATFMQLDLGSMESIRKFVDDFHETGKKLNVLINNAGVMPSSKDAKKQYTADNFEATMGTNHLGPFLLTNLLLEDLKKSGGDGGDSRIVMVVSGHHDPDSMKRKSNIQPLDFDNFFLFNEGTYSGMQAYKNSKVAVVMTAYELARKLEGSGVNINCVDPGFVPGTDFMRNSSGAQKFFSRYIMHGLLRFTKMTRSVQQGAQAITGMATDEKYKEVSGKYFRDGAEVKSSEESLDEEKQKKLWELSGGYMHLEGFDPIEVPPPPKEEEKKEEEKKEEEEAKEGEAKEDGEAKADENKTDEAKTEEQKKEGEEEQKEEEKKEEEKKEEEKKEEEKDNKTEEAKAEEPASENKEEEKKE